jgi:hypothetical protein
MGSPVRQLKKSMRGLSPIQQRMAWILLRVNGIENAMEYVKSLKEKTHGITTNSQEKDRAELPARGKK